MSTITATTTHINFRGQAREALDFYRSVSGGEMALVTYGDMGAAEQPSEADQVMWGEVKAEGGFHVMAFDVPSSRPFERGEQSFFISIRSESEEEITSLYEGLSDGAAIITELGPAPWGTPLYGMLTDRFGITWVMDVVTENSAG